MAKKRKKTDSPEIVLGPTLERRRKAGGLSGVEHIPVSPNSRVTVRRVTFRDTCPLDVYHARGKITDRQHKAGGWFASMFFRSSLSGHSLISGYRKWLITGHMRGEPEHDARVTLWNALLRSGLGRETEDRFVLTPRGRVVLNVCGYEETIQGTSHYDTLRAGLDQLADERGY